MRWFFCCLLMLYLLSAEAFAGQPGSDLASIEFRNFKNEKIKLSEFSGKPLLLTFWATWCEACLKEFETLDQIQEKFPTELQVVAVSVDSDLKSVETFLMSRKIKFQVLWSVNKSTDLQKIGSDGLVPVTVFYDSNLEFIAQFKGYKEVPFVRALVAPVLAGHRTNN